MEEKRGGRSLEVEGRSVEQRKRARREEPRQEMTSPCSAHHVHSTVHCACVQL